MTTIQLPKGPHTIEKGVSLKAVFAKPVIEQLATNIHCIDSTINRKKIYKMPCKVLNRTV